VSTAANRREQIVLASESDGRKDVGDARALRNHLRVFVDACIPDVASLVIADIRWLEHLTVKR